MALLMFVRFACCQFGRKAVIQIHLPHPSFLLRLLPPPFSIFFIFFPLTLQSRVVRMTSLPTTTTPLP